MTDCRVAGIPGYFWCRDRCSMPGRLGGRSAQERGREGKSRKHGGRDLGARAAHRWPVASLHHPLPGLGSRAHLCQAERPDTLSVIVKGPLQTGL